jgi:hypothetical protein
LDVGLKTRFPSKSIFSFVGVLIVNIFSLQLLPETSLRTNLEERIKEVRVLVLLNFFMPVELNISIRRVITNGSANGTLIKKMYISPRKITQGTKKLSNLPLHLRNFCATCTHRNLRTFRRRYLGEVLPTGVLSWLDVQLHPLEV